MEPTFGMQYFHNFKNLDDLRDFKVKSSVISPGDNELQETPITYGKIS
ncbi:MAG: hypothetical protein CM15mP70_18450 [Pelagibacteraceae bacterium]|nr:MAG: hypothetical protein CM15mP70_18450 [Pelagibacteraceae bacterium]